MGRDAHPNKRVPSGLLGVRANTRPQVELQMSGHDENKQIMHDADSKQRFLGGDEGDDVGNVVRKDDYSFDQGKMQRGDDR